jgi:predicted amidohydrolase
VPKGSTKGRMTRSINVAAVQLRAHDRADFCDRWPQMFSQIRQAAEGGAQLVVVPEGTLPAYVLGYEPVQDAEIAQGLQQLQQLAAQRAAVIVVGAARRSGPTLRNSALVIDADGSIAGAADKHFLWHFDRQWFAPGDRLEPVQTALGKIGALVCADGRIPTIARTLVDRGAQALVMPTAWVTSGRDPEHLENVQADLLGRVRARENDAAFIAANKCGVELRCVAYCGKSQIVGPDGTVLAMGDQYEPGTLTGTVELRVPSPPRTSAGAGPAPLRSQHPARIAVTYRARRPSDEQLLRILEADELISADTQPSISDDQMLDPGYLPRARFEGVDIALWKTTYEPQWQVRFARARALELRMYVIVIDERQQRAYAVDPDGTVVCGTYGEYEVAGFAYDPARTAATLVAPGTDVRAGIERAAEHAPA